MSTTLSQPARATQQSTLLDRAFGELDEINRSEQLGTDADRRKVQARYNQLLRRLLWKNDTPEDAELLAECIQVLRLTKRQVQRDLGTMRTIVQEEADAAHVATRATAVQAAHDEAQAVMQALRDVQQKVRVAESEFQVSRAAWKNVSFILPRRYPELFVLEEEDAEAA